MEEEPEMKRTGNLFETVCSFKNLWLAYQKASRGNGKKEEAARFSFNLERELLLLREELSQGTYCPGRYRYFKIYYPKERTISVAPFRDRVVHHAIVNVLEPIYEKSFIFDSYATRKNKGTHRAIKRAQVFFGQNAYYLKFDVDKYFDTVSHEILLALVARKIKDKGLLALLKVIVANNDVSRGLTLGKGLPIGNLTSQFFANVYLDAYDHYAKEIVKAKYYIRYMDDMVLFHNDRAYLKEALMLTKQFLQERLGLRLKESATFLNTRLNGIPFLGFRVFPSLLRIKAENVRRFKAKIRLREKQLQAGIIDEERYCMSVASLVGHVKFADSIQFRRDIFGKA